MIPPNLPKPIIPPEHELQAMLAEVRRNRKALEDCARPHDFVPTEDPRRPLWKKYRCTRCGGVVPFTEGRAYLEGFRDGAQHDHTENGK